MYDRSWTWARNLLLQWEKEQLAGGPVRVWRSGKKGALQTTLAILQRDMPPARDPVIMRKLKEHDKDLDTMARRIEALTTLVHSLKNQLRDQRSGVRITG